MSEDDDDIHARKMRKQSEALMRMEILHREQMHDLELRKGKAELASAELGLLSTKIGIARILGPKDVLKRLENEMQAAIAFDIK